ncbi:MAG: DUF2169 domain-containing protein [Polyangiaceae bacterium]
MQVLSRCPLRVGSILWLPRAGACALTVVCKATFRLAPEVSPLADDQEPVTEVDEHHEHDEQRSLARASDLVPFKRQPEVLLVGHAYAPQGASVGQLVARLTVAEIDKAIEVTGDRHFKLDGSLSHPARFAKMPLTWERAAGGPDTSNPAGVPMGSEARADGWGRIAVPNLVSQGRLVSSREDVVPPACFAPMAPEWPARLARLHRFAGVVQPGAWHARPLPADFDGGYFNAAPQDQLLHELLGTERLTLENLHPQHALLSTRLAGVKPRAHADLGTGGTFEVPLTCDTLLIDTDRGLASVTFRGALSLDYPERAGWVVVTMEGHSPSTAPRASHAGLAVEPARGSHAGFAAEAAAAVRGSHAGFAGEAAAAVRGSHAGLGADGVADGRAGGGPDVHETVAFDGGDVGATALPFAVDASFLDFEETGDLDDEETFASDRAKAVARATTEDVGGAMQASGAGAGGAPAVPPVVPVGPRLGAFRLASTPPGPPREGAASAGGATEAHGARVPALPAAPSMSDLDDAPTVDPEEAALFETADGPEAALFDTADGPATAPRGATRGPGELSGLATGATRAATPGTLGLPIPGAPKSPIPGAPQPPIPGAPQPPIAGAPQPPISGAPQPPISGAPQFSVPAVVPAIPGAMQASMRGAMPASSGRGLRAWWCRVSQADNDGRGVGEARGRRCRLRGKARGCARSGWGSIGAPVCAASRGGGVAFSRGEARERCRSAGRCRKRRRGFARGCRERGCRLRLRGGAGRGRRGFARGCGAGLPFAAAAVQGEGDGGSRGGAGAGLPFAVAAAGVGAPRASTPGKTIRETLAQARAPGLMPAAGVGARSGGGRGARGGSMRRRCSRRSRRRM